MTRRIFTLVLVFLMLAKPSLAVAHTHHGEDFTEPPDHDSRPHFHFDDDVHHDRAHGHTHGDHSHHGHSGTVTDSDGPEAALMPSGLPVSDHDSDAVYCGERVTIARRGSVVSAVPKLDPAGTAIHRIANQTDRWFHSGLLRAQPPSVGSGCPIYLRTLSLRF
jgi:hypothetical protein